MSEPARAEPRYRAFLSYSHKDAAEAARIHRRLESYRLPGRLVGRDSDRGPVPRRLSPIFRDREELAASADLSETVRAALDQSGALIVLCSPAAAASLWVAEEIAAFRALHPDRPVLAAIIAGEPPDCFPAPLRAGGGEGAWHEPLATDLRRDRDGPHLGLLKLVAGLAGIGLDDLVQRDAARKIRRVTAVTGIALAAMLIMAALALFALDARREAERQRAEAEGLIEFMLTDLRQRLRSVGRLEVLHAANTRALEHYGEQHELGGLSEDALLRRARVLHLIGIDSTSLGNFDAALSAFQEARRTTAEQLERNLQDPERLHAHFRSEYHIGRVYQARRNWVGARRQFAFAAAAAERLIGSAPDNPDYMMTAGSIATDFGNLELAQARDAAAAERAFARAAAWFGRAVEARPDDRDAQRALANAYANIADTHYMRLAWAASLEARQRQFAILQRLRDADASDMETLYRLALAERGLAASLAKTDDYASARSRLGEAHRHAQQLTDHDPRNADWQLLKAMVACELLFREVDAPRGEARARIRGEVTAAAAVLEAQRNPRISNIANCRRAVEQEARS